MNKREAKALGRERGFNAASWVDLPEIGKRYWTESDGWTEIESDDQAWDLVARIASDIEWNDRQFSPFKFIPSEINGAEDRADGLWEAFEEGITAGIARNVRLRRRLLNGPKLQRRKPA